MGRVGRGSRRQFLFHFAVDLRIGSAMAQGSRGGRPVRGCIAARARLRRGGVSSCLHLGVACSAPTSRPPAASCPKFLADGNQVFTFNAVVMFLARCRARTVSGFAALPRAADAAQRDDFLIAGGLALVLSG